jgi:competence protein ComEA
MRFYTLMLPVFLLFSAVPMVHANDASPLAAAPVKASAAAVGRINVNTADALTLTGLKGVGEKKAQAIIAYRKSKGPFSSLEQLEAVPGIGPSIIAKNKSVIVFR